LLRTLWWSLASFKRSAGKYGFKRDSSLSSFARAIRISTLPTNSSSLASVDADILSVELAEEVEVVEEVAKTTHYVQKDRKWKAALWRKIRESLAMRPGGNGLRSSFAFHQLFVSM